MEYIIIFILGANLGFLIYFFRCFLDFKDEVTYRLIKLQKGEPEGVTISFTNGHIEDLLKERSMRDQRYGVPKMKNPPPPPPKPPDDLIHGQYLPPDRKRVYVDTNKTEKRL